MAISFINGGSGANTAGGGATVVISGWSLQQDDLIIVALSNGATSDVNISMITAGYNEVADLYSNDDRDTNLGVFFKFMGASPDANVQGNGAGGFSGTDMSVMAFRGVDTSGPFDTTSVTTTGVNSILADGPSISTAGTWTVLAVGGGHTNAGSTFTMPAGYTTNAQTPAAANDANKGIVGLGYNSAPANPEDPAAVTYSATNDVTFSWAAVTMALRPAAGISGGTTDGFGIPIF